MKFCAEKPPLRQAANRYMPPYDESQQIEQLCLRNYLTDKIK